MATQAIAGAADKVLAAAVPGLMKPMGMQVYSAHPVWSKINQGNRKRPWEGESIQAAVMTSVYGKADSYANDDVLDTTTVEPFTAVQFELGGYQVAVNITGQKIRKVQHSPNKVFELAKQETMAAILSMQDKMSDHFFQTTNNAKGILSLDTITDATTTIAGLAGSGTWGGTTTASGSFASQGKNDLMTMAKTLSVYQPSLDASTTTGFQFGPDLHITRRQEYQFYWNSLESGIRYEPMGKGDVGLQLTFDGAPIIVDQHVTSGRWYTIRTSELYLYVMPDADFTGLQEQHPTTQPDMWQKAFIWNGQICFNSRRHFGKLTGLVA